MIQCCVLKFSQFAHFHYRKGGGDGAGDIRKIAYFEQCIDPSILKGRDKTRVVTYRCPGNTACQVTFMYLTFGLSVLYHML